MNCLKEIMFQLHWSTLNFSCTIIEISDINLKVGDRVPFWLRHNCLKKCLRHFHTNIHSWVTNECCCQCTVDTTNINYTRILVFINAEIETSNTNDGGGCLNIHTKIPIDVVWDCLQLGGDSRILAFHDDVIKWKHFPCNWPFVRGIHRSRWIPYTKDSDAELWCFLWSGPE